MKYLIICGVAAGTKAAAKLKRADRSATVRLITKSADISYAGCGLPYYIGGVIDDRGALIVQTPDSFSALTGVEVVTGAEVTSVDTAAKTVSGVKAGVIFTESYDALIIATGAAPVMPDVPGIDLPGVFPVRTPDDAESIRGYIEKNGCKNVIVCGGGFIGLEMAENLLSRGLRVTVIEAAAQLMPGALDSDMADYAARRLCEAGVRIMTNAPLRKIAGEGRVQRAYAADTALAADIVIVAAGVRPATAFLEGSGVELRKGAVVVDSHMRSSVPDVYAAGDCALVRNALTGGPQYSAMGSSANISARVLAKALTGGADAYGGCLGTGVAKILPSLSVGRTGLTERQAKDAGYDAVSALCIVDDKPHYYPGADSFAIKLVADRASRRLLGVQVYGAVAVDKLTDIAVVGISKGAVIDDFDTLDFAYAPPFSTAIHPFAAACIVLENKLSGEMRSMTPAEYASGAADGYIVIDAQPAPAIPGARWVDIAKVNAPLDGIAKDSRLLLVCAKGKRAYLLQNRLKALGYTNTAVLEGGTTFNTVRVKRAGGALSPDDIKRVKGLGCLRDKRYDDVFNVRVITRNGKITSAEHRAVAEAADEFGSGEVTMTTRLTLEIQGVLYENIEPLREKLAEAGLETGGTGPKVRPIVSCKGTTCQYGLIDTFALSEKLHERFYKGYSDVVLPHKFKMAVGGCPNNCAKPDLNDIGIIGQSVVAADADKCRACKVCQVEKSCPIKVAALDNGKITIDSEKCSHCGRCIKKCPFGAMGEKTRGYKVYIGGRWGRKTAQGRALNKVFTSDEEVLDLVERAILFFRDEGVTGERFSDTIDRLGFDYTQDKLLSGGVDKAAALSKNVGGASC